MKTSITLLVLFSTLVGVLIYVLNQRGDQNNADTNVESAAPAPLLTFDQATVYTCADGSVVATAFKTNDKNVVEVSLPEVGPVLMSKDTEDSETKYTTETGYVLYENVNTVTIEKDAEIIFKDCMLVQVKAEVPQPEVVAGLIGTKWQWIETTFASGTPTKPNNPDDFSITFTAENRFSANTDCNNIGGSYSESLTGGILFTDIISTRMACEGDSKEGIFIMQLEQITDYEVADNDLRLQTEREGAKSVMKFIKLP